MDYRIEHREGQQFIALVKSFPNESINDDNDCSILTFGQSVLKENLLNL